MLELIHGGKIGDVIYGLPIIRALMEKETQRQARIYLRLGPNLDLVTAKALVPLLDSQPGLSAEVWEGQKGLDLDQFRRHGLDLGRYSIPRYYALAFPGLAIDLCRPWLAAQRDRSYGSTLLVSRSPRYRNNRVDYRCLRKLPDVRYVGHKHEWQAFEREQFALPFVETDDLHKLARVIAGCGAFVGNQSGVYAIAEALKVPRLLEVCMMCPNVIPCGGVCLDAIDQRGFLAGVEALQRTTTVGEVQHNQKPEEVP